MRHIEPLLVVLCLLGFFDVAPVEHLQVTLFVSVHQEHGHGGGVSLLDNAVDDGSEGISLRRAFDLALVLATEHQGRRT